MRPSRSLLAAWLLAACQKEVPPAPAAASASGPVVASAAPVLNLAVAGELGFDLAPLTDGSLLATADRDGGVSVRWLDHQGNQRGERLALAPPAQGKAFEVAATSLGTRLGVAWVARTADGATQSFAALGDAATTSFSPPQPLGESAPRNLAEAGFVAISASENEGFVVLRRGPDEPCDGDARRRCASFGFREVLPSGVETRGLAMSVPAPCSRPLAGFVSEGERWHYGLCAQDQGQPVTTHFMRQLAPFYVDVHKSLEGCTPLGAARLTDDVVFVGDCPKGRRGVRVAGMGSKPRSLDLSQATLSCMLGRPVLRVPGDGGFELGLREPRAGLELLLPSRFSPGRSRSVWTGLRLLSATWLAGDVVLRSFQCKGRDLVPG